MDTCGRCGAFVQPDWDRCKICGADRSAVKAWEPDQPSGPGPADEGDAPWRTVKIVLGVVALLAAGIGFLVAGASRGGEDELDDTREDILAAHDPAPPTTAGGPVLYEAGDGSFSAEFPREPVVQRELIDLPNGEWARGATYEAVKGFEGFAVVHLEPAEGTDTASWVFSVPRYLEVLAEPPEATLESRPGTLDGRDGTYFRLTTPTVLIEGVILPMGPRAFVVQRSGVAWDEESFRTFKASFTLGA